MSHPFVDAGSVPICLGRDEVVEAPFEGGSVHDGKVVVSHGDLAIVLLHLPARGVELGDGDPAAFLLVEH